jgi:DNA excision repair protein ERCC-4
MRTHADLRPEDVTAVCDSREQRPLDLELRTLVAALPTGDYSIAGLEHSVCIERKSLQDLVMCVGRERERFERELQRMRAYETRVIVIESSRAAVELKQYRGEVHPNAVLGSVYSWIARGITVEWAGDRAQAAKAVSRILFCAARDRWRQLQGLKAGLKLLGGSSDQAS